MQGSQMNTRLYGQGFANGGGVGMMQNSIRMGLQGYSSQPELLRSHDPDTAMKQGEGKSKIVLTISQTS